MTDNEITCWVCGLADTNTARASIIHDLLRHRDEDRMSQADMEVCKRGLRMITLGIVRERKPQLTGEEVWNQRLGAKLLRLGRVVRGSALE